MVSKRAGGTYVGDDTDDSADEDGEEVPCLRSDTCGRGDAPDDQAGEHGVAQGLELRAFPFGRRSSLHDRRRDRRARRDLALGGDAAGHG